MRDYANLKKNGGTRSEEKNVFHWSLVIGSFHYVNNREEHPFPGELERICE
jgi:hypothetical protein